MGILCCIGAVIFLCCRLHSKEAAARAIVGVHGTELNGYQVRCSWGKEVPEPSGVQSPQKVPAPAPSMPQMRPPENVSIASVWFVH